MLAKTLEIFVSLLSNNQNPERRNEIHNGKMTKGRNTPTPRETNITLMVDPPTIMSTGVSKDFCL